MKKSDKPVSCFCWVYIKRNHKKKTTEAMNTKTLSGIDLLIIGKRKIYIASTDSTKTHYLKDHLYFSLMLSLYLLSIRLEQPINTIVLELQSSLPFLIFESGNLEFNKVKLSTGLNKNESNILIALGYTMFTAVIGEEFLEKKSIWVAGLKWVKHRSWSFNSVFSVLDPLPYHYSLVTQRLIWVLIHIYKHHSLREY